jgi:hypothetical protein
MPDVSDAKVILHCPKERNCIDYLTVAENVTRSCLSLSSSKDMLYSNPLTTKWIRPTRNITRGKDTRRTCLEVLIKPLHPISRYSSRLR